MTYACVKIIKLLLGLAAVGRRRQTATKLYATKVATAHSKFV